MYSQGSAERLRHRSFIKFVQHNIRLRLDGIISHRILPALWLNSQSIDNASSRSDCRLTIQVNTRPRLKYRTLKVLLNSSFENISQKDIINMRFLSLQVGLFSSEEAAAPLLRFLQVVVVALVLLSWMWLVWYYWLCWTTMFDPKMLGFLLRPFPAGFRFARKGACHTVK